MEKSSGLLASTNYVGKSKKYKNVYIYDVNGFKKYRGEVLKVRSNFYDNERDAAIFVDKELIRIGKKPRNIFINKQ